MRNYILAGLLVGVFGVPAAQSEEAAEHRMDALTVVGAAGGVQNVAGSTSFISEADLEALGQNDLLRVLRMVPGVNLQEEEGYGLRPNIGLRGTGSDRSSRIMLLEDGIPIAPAVYAAPSAYYFPNFTRMTAVEVTKGPGVIQYGPRTTGGSVHLISRAIPDETEAFAEMMFGDFGRQKLHAYAGSRMAMSESLAAGFLIETVQDEADGFLKRDNGGDAGFDVDDLMIKAGLYGEGASPWSVELKCQTKTEVSDQTYLGLTSSDYSADPYRLYASTARDQMRNENELFQLTGRVELSPDTEITLVAYQNDIARNWYKVQGVSDTGNGAADDRGISSILNDPYTATGGMSDDYLLLTGAISLDDSIVIRANNRTYQTRGVQAVLGHEFSAFGVAHALTAGARYHEDFEDRFQHEDAYRLENGNLFLTSAGLPGSNANRLTEAQAVSAFVMDRVELTDKLTVTGGVRFEDYELARLDYSGSDPTRATGPTRVRSAESSILLPSLSALYELTDDWSLLAGVHKGFSPIGATDTGAEDEIAWNYEIGARFDKEELSVEVIGYLNDFENLLGECTNSTGSFCVAGDAFNGGKFTAKGVELTAEWDGAQLFDGAFTSIPLALSYAYSDTEFETNFNNAFFGNVHSGDELNYVPEHQLTLSAGLVGKSWGVHTSLNTLSDARHTIGAGAITSDDLIEARTLVDGSAYFDLNDHIRLKLQVENLFNQTYVAARRPAGVRPGKPQEILVGFALSF